MIPFLAGAATVVAFAPLGAFPVALITFALLVRWWRKASPRRCFFRGFWFGLGLLLAGVTWVYVSLHDFGGMPAPVAAFCTLGFCAFLALFPATAGWLQARVPAPTTLRVLLLIPAAWTLFEWFRGVIFTGFPWLSIGYAAAGWPLQGYAPLGGVYTLTFLTLMLAGAVWLLFRRKIIAVTVFIAVFGAGEALRHVEWTTPAGPAIEASLLQGNVAQKMKFRPDEYARILETYARLVSESKAKLIVLPETALPTFLDRVDPAYLADLAAVARRNGGDLLLGVAYREPPRAYYNSVVTLGVSPTQMYHKVHLVPFGEFVPPFGFDWAMRLMDIPMSDFSRGKPAPPPLEAAGQRIAVNICYEDAFGDEIAARLPEATLLVNVSNVAWFGDSLAPAQHLQIARMRAIETGRMHLTATNTGITAAIDRDGAVLGRLPTYVEGKLDIRAQGYTGMTPYARWYDWPILALCLGLLVAWTIIGRIKK